MQVGFKRRGALAITRAVDLQILHDPLDVVARLGKGNALDPIDRVDLGIARITVLCDPLLNSAAARIITRKGQNEGAAIVLEQRGDFSGTHLCIVDRIGDETLPIVADPEPLGSVTPGHRCDLHQSNCLSRRHVALVEAAFLRAFLLLHYQPAIISTTTVSFYPSMNG